MQKMFSLLITIFCMFSLTFQQGLCAVLPIQQMALHLVDLGEEIAQYTRPYGSFAASINLGAEFHSIQNKLIKGFEDLAGSISESEDSYMATELFAQAFIDQINSKRNTSYTVVEACQNIRENIDSIGVPLEYRDYLLQGLDSLQNNDPSLLMIEIQDPSLGENCFKLYWPWEWSWFGLNTKIQNKVPNLACAISGDKWKVIALALFLCTVALVAIFSPSTLTIVLPAIAAGVAAIL